MVHSLTVRHARLAALLTSPTSSLQTTGPLAWVHVRVDSTLIALVSSARLVNTHAKSVRLGLPYAPNVSQTTHFLMPTLRPLHATKTVLLGLTWTVYKGSASLVLPHATHVQAIGLASHVT